VDAVLEECDRVTARINQFLAFARSGEPQLGSVNVAELIDELLVLLEPDVDAKDLTLDRQQVSPGLTISADREMFRQALFNLLQNAIQFAPFGGLITLSAKPCSAGAWRVEVSDSGPGVSGEHVESLFMPYFTTRPDGTGLGLAIVRQIAVAHRWQLGYSPRSGGGATFWISGTDV
jgi:two-component system sensor histidine kinase HydH